MLVIGKHFELVTACWRSTIDSAGRAMPYSCHGATCIHLLRKSFVVRIKVPVFKICSDTRLNDWPESGTDGEDHKREADGELEEEEENRNSNHAFPQAPRVALKRLADLGASVCLSLAKVQKSYFAGADERASEQEPSLGRGRTELDCHLWPLVRFVH